MQWSHWSLKSPFLTTKPQYSVARVLSIPQYGTTDLSTPASAPGSRNKTPSTRVLSEITCLPLVASPRGRISILFARTGLHSLPRSRHGAPQSTRRSRHPCRSPHLAISAKCPLIAPRSALCRSNSASSVSPAVTLRFQLSAEPNARRCLRATPLRRLEIPRLRSFLIFQYLLFRNCR